MKNRGYCLRILLMVLIFGMLIIGCDFFKDHPETDKDGNKIVTFSLDKIDSRTFTMTVSGANWVPKNMGHANMFINANLTESGYPLSLYNNLFAFNQVLTTPTVLTYNLNSSFTNITGTVSLNNEPSFLVYGDLVTDGGQASFTLTGAPSNGSTNYQVNPNKSSITF